MKRFKKLVTGAAIIGSSLYFGSKGIQDARTWYNWNEGVTDYIEIAGKSIDVSSINEALETAYKNAKRIAESQGKQETPYSDANVFADLVEETLELSHKIEDSIKNPDSPTSKIQSIPYAYEALYNAIAEETWDNADDSLISILKHMSNHVNDHEASSDYEKAADYLKIGLIYADIGELDKAIESFQKAYDAIERYPDEMPILTTTQGVAERFILSAISELEEINHTDPSLKYSPEWWERIEKVTNIIKGHESPCLEEMAENIEKNYKEKAAINFLISLGILGLYFVHRFSTSNYSDERNL